MQIKQVGRSSWCWEFNKYFSSLQLSLVPITEHYVHLVTVDVASSGENV